METVEKIIKASLEELLNIGSEVTGARKSTSKLIFPQYRKEEGKDAKQRVSEQEARFLFVREIEKEEQKKYYYSVETPTVGRYSFTGIGSRSASVDICLYTKINNVFKREHLVEFKQGTVKTIQKDFKKLLGDENKLTNYFIHISDVEDFKKRSTVKSIMKKYTEAIDNSKSFKSRLCIFLFNRKTGQLIIFNPISEKGKDIGEEKCFEGNITDYTIR